MLVEVIAVSAMGKVTGMVPLHWLPFAVTVTPVMVVLVFPRGGGWGFSLTWPTLVRKPPAPLELASNGTYRRQDLSRTGSLIAVRLTWSPQAQALARPICHYLPGRLLSLPALRPGHAACRLQWWPKEAVQIGQPWASAAIELFCTGEFRLGVSSE
jgi:hypothetical protein